MKSGTISNAPAEQEKAKLSVILGSTESLPEEHKNVIRIFLSSTFTDMSVERNRLMVEVFPKLKKYCQESYGQQFQVVDMRWGVQDQANDDHSTSELCMREIINCQRESAGPNFVLLLGNRYGTRHLKKCISVEHWNILTSHIQDSKVTELLNTWYKEDTNSIPSQYILQPISSVKDGTEIWKNNSKLMYNAISKAAVKARSAKKLSPETAQQYIRSVTEEEVDIAGILSDNQKQKSNCLAFVRQINNIDLQHPKAKRFIDMTEAKEKDKEGQDLLKKLTKKVKAKMPRRNIKEYSIDWSDIDGINAEDHKDYLQKFSDDFYNEIKRMVDAAAANEDQTAKVVHEHKLCREVLAHSRLALDKLSKVVPRTDILDQTKSYVTGDSNQPMVVHGHSGCGKTSVMASVATQCREWLGNGDKTAVILRFLGTTQQSSDIELLLESLNHQLSSFNSMNVDGERSGNKSLRDLTKEFHKEVKTAEERNDYKVVIVLDSVDQLRKNDHAFSLTWLPETLPPNVKLIVSTLPDIYGILKAARSLGFPEDNFLEVKSLDESSSWMIIDKWLEMSQRKLTIGQRKTIEATFKDKLLSPLYIKLVFDILVKWRSYNQATSIPTDVISCMEKLFIDLENKHGKLQVELALCYLTCCPGGISQTELEDILSIDDSFLTVVFQYHVPPLRRIPPTLWVRIKNDIRDYIVEKESNGVAAMYWYHRQFIEFATRRYVEGEQIKHCLTTLSDYFTGKWSDRPKPFTYTESQMEKLNLTDSSAQALRLVASQPTRYSKQKFNTRKVSVLSQIWSDENLKEMVFINSSRYIMDIQFLTAKFSSDSWSNMESELSAFSSYMKQKGDSLTDEEKIYSTEYTYLYSVLSMYNGLISQSPFTCSAQLFACLQDKYNLSAPKPPFDSQLPNLTWFLTELTSGQGVDMCPLVPVCKTLDSPGGMQVLVRQSTSNGSLFPFQYKGKSAVATMVEDMVVYSLADDGIISEALSLTVTDSSRDGTHISFSEDENYLLVYSSPNLRLISLENKRVELDVSELGMDETDEEIYFHAKYLSVFYNPLARGRDSIIIYACQRDLAVVYSVKLRKAVWYHHIPEPEEGGPMVEIHHMSVHNTDQDYVKELVVVYSRHTNFYTMELQEDGGVKVSLKEVVPNAFANKNGVKSVKLLGNYFAHGKDQMSVIMPENLPSNSMFILSNESDMQENIWSYYNVTKEGQIFMVGRLRSGLEILATRTSSNDEFLFELYSVKGHDQIALAAAFSTTKEFELKHQGFHTVQMYLVPNSDVLLLLVDTLIHVLFLTELDDLKIKVTYCYEISVANGDIDDFLADPRGYLVLNAYDNSTKFWDLTLYTDSIETVNPRLTASSRCRHSRSFPAPHNYALTLQDDGHIWDAATNNHVGALGIDVGSGLLVGSMIFPGDGKWQFIVGVVGSNFLVSFGLNLPTDGHGKLEMEQLNRSQLTPVANVFIYDLGMLVLTKELTIYHVTKAILEEKTQEEVDLGLDKPKVSVSRSVSWCFTGKYLIICAKEEDAVHIYDVTSSFKFMRRVEKCRFTYSAHFKNFDVTIISNELSDDQLHIFDVQTLDFKPAKLPKQYTNEQLSMLEMYNKDECCYCTDEQPNFFIECSKGILKLDVTKWQQWATGEGVVSLGSLPSFWRYIRLSTSRSYIAGAFDNKASLELARLTEDSIVPMGLFTFTGHMTSFLFSSDDKYITVMFASGEVVCMKVLNVESPDLATEAAKLPCAQNKVCESQEEMLSDPRWASLASLERDAGKRSEDTLYNFMEKFTRERDRDVSHLIKDKLARSELPRTLDGTPAKFIPTINPRPLNVDSLLRSLGIAKQKKENPASSPQPEPGSTVETKSTSSQHSALPSVTTPPIPSLGSHPPSQPGGVLPHPPQNNIPPPALDGGQLPLPPPLGGVQSLPPSGIRPPPPPAGGIHPSPPPPSGIRLSPPATSGIHSSPPPPGGIHPPPPGGIHPPPPPPGGIRPSPPPPGGIRPSPPPPGGIRPSPPLSAILPPQENVPAPPPLPPQKFEIPKNLKLYQEMPTEEREKKLDKAIEEINKISSATCSIS